MNLSRHILELLEEHDCVIVPNFGGFVCNYQPAGVVNLPSTTFTPPTKKVVYNKSLNHDDGLLTHKISRDLEISFSEAKEKVIHEVDVAIRTLKQEKSIEFDGIGEFIINENNKLEFRPSIKRILLTDSFGLEKFHFNVVNEKIQLRRKKAYNGFDAKKLLRGKKILKPIFFGSALVLAIALLPKVVRDDLQSSSFNFFDSLKAEQTEQRAYSEKTVSETFEAKEQNDVEEVLTKQTSKKEVLNYEEPKVSFYLIAGCFKDLKNAEIMASNLEKEGYEADIISNRNIYRVYSGKFSNKKEAISSLLEQKKGKLKDLWIYQY